jgi:sporulation protein YlmC with PRC-barrel domain
LSLPANLNLLRDVRDLQVVDSDGRHCGICDDIEFDTHASRAAVHALLIGPDAIRRRMPKWLAGLSQAWQGRLTRIPWQDVESVTSVIRLKRSASSYGLLRMDARLAAYMRWIPAL